MIEQQETVEEKWQRLKARFQLMDELMEDEDFQDLNGLMVLSDQLDQLVVESTQMGSLIRRACYRASIQMQEALTSDGKELEEMTWLNELIERAQVKK